MCSGLPSGPDRGCVGALCARPAPPVPPPLASQVWVTTAPIAETRACCMSEQYNYSQPAGLPDTFATIGYCHADAQRQNAAVAAMLGADFPPARVAIADTHSAVSKDVRWARGCSPSAVPRLLPVYPGSHPVCPGERCVRWASLRQL